MRLLFAFSVRDTAATRRSMRKFQPNVYAINIRAAAGCRWKGLVDAGRHIKHPLDWAFEECEESKEVEIVQFLQVAAYSISWYWYLFVMDDLKSINLRVATWNNEATSECCEHENISWITVLASMNEWMNEWINDTVTVSMHEPRWFDEGVYPAIDHIQMAIFVSSQNMQCIATAGRSQ